MPNTTNSTVDVGLLVALFGGVLQGFVFGVCNLLIGLSVLKYGALRQFNQYVLLMSLAFADAANLIGFSFGALYQVWVIQGNAPMVTPLQCLMAPHLIIWLVAYPFSTLMLVILSCDRLLMVSLPSFYILSLPSPKYARLFVLCGFLLTCIFAILGVAAVFRMSAEPKSPVCLISTLFQYPDAAARVFLYLYERVSFLALLSVVIFAAVPLVHRLRTSHLTEEEQEAQNRMTRTVAISCLCTLFLFCIPDRLAFVAKSEGYGFLSALLWLISMTNPFANIIIYELRHFEMRVALKSLLKCKTMPQSLNAWPKPNVQTPAPKAFQMVPLPRANAVPAEQMEIVECA